ncbi:hypothetical protein AcW1_009763 [Taiwanofungus camphoratus]|nr:hypothetical protein AcV5_002336 [Antrodia cinnamomea]KAI0941873.1 hypothetical protein AcV7_002442 [Antrodia cinnamomea]KAI0948179.1 hypothetical protein AcW1_009763 [Antrodia cinnamomea]KAI0948180.1 hypothetical protein AcW1_009763 [Antrodia cinnamomea]
MSHNGPTLLTIDDTSSRLIYRGSWVESGSSNEYNSTTHGTGTAGSSVDFVFNGTFVAVYGTVGTTRSNSTYVLDGSPPVSFVAPKPPSPVYREAFFSSSVLSAGLHTLNVTAMGEGSYFWLDYLQYTSTYDGQETEPTPSPASPSSSVNPSAEAPRRSIPTGAICGIVIGGVCVVLVAVFTLLYLRGWICSTTRVKQRPQNEDLDIALEDMYQIPSHHDILQKFRFLHRLPTASNPRVASSEPTSQGPQSSAMFTSVILMSAPQSTNTGRAPESTQYTAHSVS